MNSKGIAIALCILSLLGAGTYFAYKPRQSDSTEALRDPWHALERARVDHLTLQRPPENGAAVPAIELEKAGGEWRMAAPGRGPSEPRAVDELIGRLADMHVTSIAGRSADSYDDFQVDDAHAVHLTLKSGSSTVLDVYVGADLDGGTALRLPGHREIYRVGQAIHSMVTRAPREWRDREITRISRDSVRSVEWVNSHGTFGFNRNGDTWAAAPGTTIERMDTARISNLVDSVTTLRATDFGEAGPGAGLSDGAPRVTVTSSGDAGPQRVTVRLGSSSGENERFAQREGNDVVFVVGRTLAESLNPELSAFQSPPVVDGGADAAAPAPTAPPTEPPGGPGMAPGMPGMPPGPGGQGSLPPEVMEQIRRQMQQRGAAPPH